MQGKQSAEAETKEKSLQAIEEIHCWKKWMEIDCSSKISNQIYISANGCEATRCFQLQGFATVARLS